MPAARLLAAVCALLFAASAAAQDLRSLAREVQASVVTIVVRDGGGATRQIGTGFFVDASGAVVTNAHVVADAVSAQAITSDGSKWPIKQVLAEDRDFDLVKLALDIPEQRVRAARISGRVPEVAERVLVVGSPLGLSQTVSDGIISALREFPGKGVVYQISAPISPGSSGSPVVDMNGEVVGVASFQSVQGQNLNFAVPARHLLDLRMGGGRVLAPESGGALKLRKDPSGAIVISK